jgi:SRSO17 transposase
MSGVAVARVLELWCGELGRAKAHLGTLFAHPSVAVSAAAFLDGRRGPERRKTGWMRAAAAGAPGPWRQQAVLGRSHWEADALRDRGRATMRWRRSRPPGRRWRSMGPGFSKQGQSSCGGARQYAGSAGQIANCRIGVFAAYVSDQGCAFIDHQLYLPPDWANAPGRRAAAHVPDSAGFATKPQIAAAMIERAVAAGVPFDWAATDTVYGGGRIEMQLRRAGKGYVLGAPATDQSDSWAQNPPVAGTAEGSARARPAEAWQRLSAGDGAKGPRLYDWAYLELADLDADEFNAALTGLWTPGLLIRRGLSGQALAFFSTGCPAGTPIEPLVRVEGQRWALEEACETAKTALGRTHNETRSWHGWHRHVSLVMLAFALMAGVRQRANALASPPKRSDAARPRRRVASHLQQRRIEPACVSARSAWRRAHPAMAQIAHRRRQVQL